jgi:hypothetical protein
VAPVFVVVVAGNFGVGRMAQGRMCCPKKSVLEKVWPKRQAFESGMDSTTATTTHREGRTILILVAGDAMEELATTRAAMMQTTFVGVPDPSQALNSTKTQ